MLLSFRSPKESCCTLKTCGLCDQVADNKIRLSCHGSEGTNGIKEHLSWMFSGECVSLQAFPPGSCCIWGGANTLVLGECSWSIINKAEISLNLLLNLGTWLKKFPVTLDSALFRSCSLTNDTFKMLPDSQVSPGDWANAQNTVIFFFAAVFIIFQGSKWSSVTTAKLATWWLHMHSEFTDKKTITHRMQSMPSMAEVRAGNRLMLNKGVGEPLKNIMVITRDLWNSQSALVGEHLPFNRRKN